MKSNHSKQRVRCAIYTRKSTEEGLDQEFNSLDAQRESAEAYIKSQAHEGWTPVAERYDDGGFTGGNMDRPALARLLTDIQAGKVDCVVVYKVDRLSRSLLDFARMMETFDQRQVSFVSVTQQFNTATSMGRLVLNVLLSFAQFEREIISERTRDKIAATRRKGKWSGGAPLLGYDVDPRATKLVVNEAEAVRVRAIFELYVKHESLLAVVAELERRGWAGKQWTTRKGRLRGGKPFHKGSLHNLLTNVVYAGQVKYKDEVHPGEHEALVSSELWHAAQTLLRSNGRNGGAAVRNKFGALLKGLLRCASCACAMTPTHATKHRTTRYRYYLCTGAQRRGWRSCPGKSVPAEQIERLVVAQIRGRIDAAPGLAALIAQARQASERELDESETERRRQELQLQRCNRDLQRLQQPARFDGGALGDSIAKRAEVETELRSTRERLLAFETACRQQREAVRAWSIFDPAWEKLDPREQAGVLKQLVERVEYDGAGGKAAIRLRADSAPALAGVFQEPSQFKEIMP
ncbi:MAG TPA: recombinase family protein [Pirellulales bacterium]|jgi:site-specific DNA recombinase|nr:recombinase family protein [Pirellulales bacterium]